MRAFGLVYLIAYLIDCIVSIIAMLMPTFESISNLISSIMFPCTIVVLVLSCIGKLRPRRVFLTLSIFYTSLVGFGLVLGVLIAIDLGPQISSVAISTKFLHEHFPWYPPVHWILLIVWVALAVYGLRSRLELK